MNKEEHSQPSRALRSPGNFRKHERHFALFDVESSHVLHNSQFWKKNNYFFTAATKILVAKHLENLRKRHKFLSNNARMMSFGVLR